MVEGTLALSIPGLFLTCIQYFVLLQLGRNFEADFGSCILELRWIEVRLQRWGKAAGITVDGTSERPEGFLKEFGKNHGQEQVDLISDTLEQIEVQLRRAREDSQQIFKKKRNTTELELIDEVQQLKICGPKVATATRFLNKVKSGYDSHARAGAKVVAQSQWALYKKTQLESLVKALREHVAALETTIPDLERKLVATEAAEMGKEVFSVLAPIVGISDPLLAKAMQNEGPRKGFSYNDIKTDGYATARYGHLYRDTPTLEGHTSYDNMSSIGYSVVQAGNVYGYEKIPSMQSAYSSGSSNTGFGAMMHDDWPLHHAR
ncbi:hypothetical protein Q7P35_010871 [Cladosporium inversicolor]